MILTGWPVTGRDAQVVPVIAQDHQTFPLGGRRDQQVSRARGPVLASLGPRPLNVAGSLPAAFMVTVNDQVQLAPHSTSALSPPVHTTESPPFKLP